MSPSPGQILLGILAVVLGCVACATSLELVRRTRNWLYAICAAGAAAFVAGVVGQRVFPSDDAVARYGPSAGDRIPGPWDAGVSIPLAGVRLTPVALGGLLVAVAGVALVLVFEPVRGDREDGVGDVPAAPGRFEDGDAV